MHGLMMKAIQGFASDTYGPAFWASTLRRADVDQTDFEPMLSYDDAVGEAILDALSAQLNRPRSAVLEDIGTYLVSDPHVDRLRRLLRFTGVDYVDFLHALEDLPGRARLALPDLLLPRMQLTGGQDAPYVLTIGAEPEGFGHVMTGVLRAMADEYGALVMLNHQGLGPEGERICITLVEASFAKGRHFDLGGASRDGVRVEARDVG